MQVNKSKKIEDIFVKFSAKNNETQKKATAGRRYGETKLSFADTNDSRYITVRHIPGRDMGLGLLLLPTSLLTWVDKLTIRIANYINEEHTNTERLKDIKDAGVSYKNWRERMGTLESRPLRMEAGSYNSPQPRQRFTVRGIMDFNEEGCLEWT